MSAHNIKRVSGRLAAEQKRRHQQIREQVRLGRPRLTRDALGMKAEHVAIQSAILLRKREARGSSLGDVAERSGIDKSRLSKLENDPRSNPTPATLIRTASAMGVQRSIHVDVA